MELLANDVVCCLIQTLCKVVLQFLVSEIQVLCY